MGDYSPYQQKVIKRFYDNRDAISLQKLSELVTDLYLAEGKKRTQCWKRIETALKNLEIPPSRIDHLKEQDDPQLLAKLVEELLAKSSG